MKTKSLFITVLLAFTFCATSFVSAQTPPAAAPPAADAGLATRTYRVPPNFLFRGGAPVDSTARQVLEFHGINFDAKGANATLDRDAARLVVRNTEAQHQLVQTLVDGMMEGGGVMEGLVQFDVISLPSLAARKALIANPIEADLYKWLDGELEKKDSGVVLEHAHTLRVRGGQRSKVEAINEFAHVTELDPPQIPQTFGPATPATPATAPAKDAGNGRIFPPWPRTGITPSAFTFRNLGWTAEVELTFGEDRKTVDLNLAPELVRVIAQVPVGLAGEVTMPVFETRKSTTQVLTLIGQPALVSTLSPATDTGAPGGSKKDRVWLLFVTVTRPQ